MSEQAFFLISANTGCVALLDNSEVGLSSVSGVRAVWRIISGLYDFVVLVDYEEEGDLRIVKNTMGEMDRHTTGKGWHPLVDHLVVCPIYKEVEVPFGPRAREEAFFMINVRNGYLQKLEAELPHMQGVEKAWSMIPGPYDILMLVTGEDFQDVIEKKEFLGGVVGDEERDKNLSVVQNLSGNFVYRGSQGDPVGAQIVPDPRDLVGKVAKKL